MPAILFDDSAGISTILLKLPPMQPGEAHNLKVASSNLAPATTFVITIMAAASPHRRDGFGFLGKSEPGDK
jgi:hypothetical protein